MKVMKFLVLVKLVSWKSWNS